VDTIRRDIEAAKPRVAASRPLKKELDIGLPQATVDYIAKKSTGARSTSSKISTYSLSCTLQVRHGNRAKLESRASHVPLICYAFPSDKVMQRVNNPVFYALLILSLQKFTDALDKVLDILHAPKGDFMKRYPGKYLDRYVHNLPVTQSANSFGISEAVTFSFHTGVGIQPKFYEYTLGSFFAKHTVDAGVHVTAKDIKNRVISLDMIVDANLLVRCNLFYSSKYLYVHY